MEQELDPRNTPAESGSESGQIEQSQTPPSESPEEISQKLKELEERNAELQRRLRKKGNELAQYQNQTQQAAPAQGMEPDAFFTDPVNTTKQVVTSVLSEFERKQEERRQAEQYLQDFAEDRGIPRRRLNQLVDRYREAANDPEALLDMLASIDAAENTTQAIQQATQAARDSTQRNARAVTATSQATHQAPVEKPISEMTLEEHRAKLVAELGESEPNY